MSTTMKTILFRTSRVSLGVLAALATTSVACAADTDVAEPLSKSGTSSDVLEEILVTAQRTSESLSRVGISVTVIGADQLADLGVAKADDLVRLVPGFQATQNFNGAPIYTLRGVGFYTLNASATQPVGIYFDEVAVPYPYMAKGLVFDLERVEVLKGPQGTLYGRNATGGLVDFIAAKPTDHFTSGASFEFGNYQRVNGSAYVSGPVSESLRLRLAVDSQNRFEGWQRSVTRNEKLGEVNQHSVRFIADYASDGPLSVTLTGNYWDREGDITAPQSIVYHGADSPFGYDLARASVIANPKRSTQADWTPVSNQPQADLGIVRPRPLTDSTFASGHLKVGYRLSESLSIASLSSYDDLRNRDVTDLAGLQVEANNTDVRGTIRSFSQELRLVGTGDRLNWSLGGYYAKDKTTSDELSYNDQNSVVDLLRWIAASVPQDTYTQEEISNGFGNYLNIASGETRVSAAFGHAAYRFNDLLKLTVSGRYTEDKSSATTCTYDYGHGAGVPPVFNLVYPVLIPGFPGHLDAGDCYVLKSDLSNYVDRPVYEQQNESNFAWRGNLDITPNDTTLIYASISRGYKAGSFPVLAASNESQLAPVGQEELTAYEVGTKLGLLEGSVQLAASAFYYDYKDKQMLGHVEDLIFGVLQRIVNVPESHEFGIEGDVSWKINSDWILKVGAIYLDSKIGQFVTYNELSQLTNLDGKNYAYTPEFQANALIGYDAPITGSLRLTGSLAATYQSTSNASMDELALFSIKSHTLVDATIGVGAADDRWRVALYGKNLFNTYYWTGVENVTESLFRFAGMPREYGVRLTVNY